MDSSPEQEKLSKFSSAYIVPLEDTPLGLEPTFKYIIPGVGLPGAQIAGVFNIISVLSQLPDAIKRSETIAKALAQDMSVNEPWQPTRTLADDAADILKRHGLPVSTANSPLKLNGYTDKAINAWYNKNTTADYTGITTEKSPYVLEILQSCHIYSGSMGLQVRMKLIDPKTGTVIGRTRNFDIADIPAAENTFKDHGRIFKEVFKKSGHEVIQESLQDLELIKDE